MALLSAGVLAAGDPRPEPEQSASVAIKGPFAALLAESTNLGPAQSTAFEIPNAAVCYQPGCGVVADSWPPGANADYVPTRAKLQLAQDLGRYVNSFSWKGDPPR